MRYLQLSEGGRTLSAIESVLASAEDALVGTRLSGIQVSGMPFDSTDIVNGVNVLR